MFYLPYICDLCYLLVLFFSVESVMECEKWPYHFCGPQWLTEGRDATCDSVGTGPVQALLLQSSHSPYMVSHVMGWDRLLQTGSINDVHLLGLFGSEARSFRLFVHECFLVSRCWMHNPVGDRVCSAKNFKWRFFIKCNPDFPPYFILFFCDFLFSLLISLKPNNFLCWSLQPVFFQHFAGEYSCHFTSLTVDLKKCISCILPQLPP